MPQNPSQNALSALPLPKCLDKLICPTASPMGLTCHDSIEPGDKPSLVQIRIRRTSSPKPEIVVNFVLHPLVPRSFEITPTALCSARYALWEMSRSDRDGRPAAPYPNSHGTTHTWVLLPISLCQSSYWIYPHRAFCLVVAQRVDGLCDIRDSSFKSARGSRYLVHFA